MSLLGSYIENANYEGKNGKTQHYIWKNETKCDKQTTPLYGKREKMGKTDHPPPFCRKTEQN